MTTISDDLNAVEALIKHYGDLAFMLGDRRMPSHDYMIRGDDLLAAAREATERLKTAIQPAPQPVKRIVGVAIMINGMVVSMPAPNRHHHIIHGLAAAGHDIPIQGEQGFVTNEGEFVNRQDAAQIALAAGQCTVLTAPPRLFSEDIW